MFDNYPTSGTYAGEPWMPDEVAKEIVQELGLRDGDCVSKFQIIEYLGRKGIGPSWATDVAMVLRNMFGVTPIYHESAESTAGSKLLEEVSNIVNGVEQVDEESAANVFIESDLSPAYGYAVDAAFDECESEAEEAIVAALSLESLETLADVDFVINTMDEDDLNEVIAAYGKGRDRLVEAWYEVSFRPHLVEFMDRGLLNELAEAVGETVGSLTEGRSSLEKIARREATVRELRNRATAAGAVSAGTRATPEKMKNAANRLFNQSTRLSKNPVKPENPAEKGKYIIKPKIGNEDPLAARAAAGHTATRPDGVGAHGVAALRQHQIDKEAAGAAALRKGKDVVRGEQPLIQKKMLAAKASMTAAKDNAVPLPQDIKPAVHPVKNALSAIGRVADKIKSHVKTTAADAAKHLPFRSPLKNLTPDERARHDADRAVPDAHKVAAATAATTKPAEEPSDIHAAPAMATAPEHEYEPANQPALKKVKYGDMMGAGGRPSRDQGYKPKSVLGHIVHGIGRIIKHVSSKTGSGARKTAAEKAIMRANHPGMAYAMHGKPDEGELDAARHLGLHDHYKRMGYPLAGHDLAVHDGKRPVPQPPGEMAQPKPQRSNTRRQIASAN